MAKTKWEDIIPVGYPNCPDEDIERSLAYIQQRVMLQEFSQSETLEALPLMQMMQEELTNRRLRRHTNWMLGISIVGLVVAVMIVALVWKTHRGSGTLIAGDNGAVLTKMDQLQDRCEKALRAKQCPLYDQ